MITTRSASRRSAVERAEVPTHISIVPIFATIGGLIAGMVAWFVDATETLETSAEGAVFGGLLGTLLLLWGLYFPDFP